MGESCFGSNGPTRPASKPIKKTVFFVDFHQVSEVTGDQIRLGLRLAGRRD